MNHPITELKIDGMTCGHCQRAVQQALAKVHGVEHVEVFLQSGRATVTGSATTDSLLAAVEEEGYTAQIAKSDPQHG
jgi:copper chaperone